MESWRRLLSRREMRIVVGLNVFATPLYLLWAWFFVEAFFGHSNFFVWLAIALGVVVEGLMIAAWRRDRAVGATFQTAVLLLPFILAEPPHLRSWRNFQLSALLEWRLYVFFLIMVAAPGGLLAFTAICFRRWGASESD